jgi:transcriptional regulator with XRE-family HTH domain
LEIGSIIKKLRRERGLTQEELAERLDVTPQAVSKWENGAGLPDISQIVPLANVFDVPTDVLFGKQPGGDMLRIAELRERTRNVKTARDAADVSDAWRELAREMPNNYAVQLEHARTLGMKNGTLGQAAQLRDEAVRVYERILERCTDMEIRNTATSLLCHLYLETGDRDNAIKLAQSLPHVYASRELVLMDIANYGGGSRGSLPFIRDNLSLFARLLRGILQILIGTGKMYADVDDAEYERLYGYVKPLIELQFWEPHMADARDREFTHYYGNLAVRQAGRGEAEALDNAEKAAEYAARVVAANPVPDGNESIGEMQFVMGVIRDNPDFDMFRAEPRFIALVERINALDA